MRRIRHLRDDVFGVRRVDQSEARLDARQDRLAALFDEVYDDLVRFGVARTGSSSIAEDVAAATFADAARSAANDDEVDVAWLYMVARRRIIDHWRSAERRRRRVNRLVDWQRVGGDPSGRGPVSDEATEPERVRRVLAEIPDRQRALLTLRYLDGQSVSAIAETFDLTYRAAESALARARRSFVTAWEKAS